MSAFGLFELGGVAVFEVGGSERLIDSTDTGFVTVGPDEISIEGPRAPEIAAFLVRACNCHDATLKALKRVVKAARGYLDVMDIEALEAADRAIAAAELAESSFQKVERTSGEQGSQS